MKICKISLLILGFSVALIYSGCYYDEVPNIGSISKEVSFTADIIPIMNTSCNQSGCHAAGGISPDLTPGNAYESLFAIVDITNPQESQLYKNLIGSESIMPPSGKLPDSDISIILGWIEQGALNN